MKLSTSSREWGSFQELRADYLDAPKLEGKRAWLDPGPFAQEDWDRDRLHASDIGGCPRATMYRLLGTPEKPRSKASAANRRVMFWSGYRLHYLTYSALNWAGLLLAHEEPLPLPEPWSGSIDALIRPAPDAKPILYGLKTVLPNALKHSYDWDYPKEKDCLQEGVYGTLAVVDEAVEEYADRAGSNTPKLCDIDLTVWVPKAEAKMRELEAHRDNLPDLPDLLPPVLQPSYWKKRGEDVYYLKSLTYQADWRCGYCDYHLTKKVGNFGVTQADSVCKPFNEKPEEVANFKNGHLIDCKKSFEDRVEAHFKRLLPEYAVEEEES